MLIFQRIELSVLVLCALLPACSRQPLSAERKGEIEQVAVLSVLRPEVFSQDRILEATAWKIDATFSSLIEQAVVARGKQFRALVITPAELDKAMGVREGRWKKVTGAYSQALLDLVLRSAEEQGIKFVFLVTPLQDRSGFPSFKGSAGIACYDPKSEKRGAAAYFFADFSLWDVKAKKKVFREAVVPPLTREMEFASCKEVRDLKSAETELEEPVHHSMSLLVDKLFSKMGWEKAAP